jgi:uncharacterized protein (DUF433 family)
VAESIKEKTPLEEVQRKYDLNMDNIQAAPKFAKQLDQSLRET